MLFKLISDMAYDLSLDPFLSNEIRVLALDSDSSTLLGNVIQISVATESDEIRTSVGCLNSPSAIW